MSFEIEALQDQISTLREEVNDMKYELELCSNLSFEEWFASSGNDPEYISICREGWYAGQENK